MSDAVDKHLDEAIAALDDIPVSELEATADAIGSRRHSLFEFASIFRNVADARGESWGTDIPRFHLREYVSRADEELAAQIAEAPAPFWEHVRKALKSNGTSAKDI